MHDAIQFTRDLYKQYAEFPQEDTKQPADIRHVPSQLRENIDSEDKDYLRHQELTTPASNRSRKRREIMDKLDQFFKEDPITLNLCLDPLAWWLFNHATVNFSILQKLAMDVFTMPAISSECERVFSQIKKVVTNERNRLKADTIEALECQKHWLRQRAVILY